MRDLYNRKAKLEEREKEIEMLKQGFSTKR
jgi:hypothetical protein